MRMVKEDFELRHIFGLKLKEIRQQKDITYNELSTKSGLSVSYLNEIESGKKYPKGDKILKLANALEVPYDDLVSLKVPNKLQPVLDLIGSNFIKDFPLDQFGINPKKLIQIVAHDPAKTNAFIRTIMRISRNHELKQEHFYKAAIRSYRELHDNYFEDLEDVVEALHLEYTELKEVPFTPEIMEQILLTVGVRTDFDALTRIDILSDLRSLYHPKQRLLYINKGLTKGQKNFLLGREIAFQWLKIKNRPLATPLQGNPSFDELLNNYFASYFSAALIIPQADIIKDVKSIFSSRKWDSKFLNELVNRYDATPEMVMQRLTSILPTYFGLKNLYFLRFVKSKNQYTLTKELHLSAHHNPHANELNEHYCRRWLGIKSIIELEKQAKKSNISLIGNAQRVRYYETGNEYFEMSMAFPNVSNLKESISVTIGFVCDKNLENKIKFISDPDVPTMEVNITCERCEILGCKERAVDPIVNTRLKNQSLILEKIDELIAQ